MRAIFSRVSLSLVLLVTSVPAVRAGADPVTGQLAPAARTPAQEAELAKLKARYGSRFLCEASRERTISGASLVMMVAGMFGGYYLIKEKQDDGTYTHSQMGMLAGGALGYGAGWLLGRAVTPDCSLLEWTPAEIEKMEMFRLAQKAYADCMRRRNGTISRWSLGCGLSGGLVGGLGVYAAVGGGGEGALLAILGGLVGSGVGYLAGDLIGRAKAEDCGTAPRPEEIDLKYRAQELRNSVPLVPSSSTVMQ